MGLERDIVSAKNTLQRETGIDTSWFAVHFSSVPQNWGYYAVQSGDKYTLKYIDERGGVHILCANGSEDAVRYHCYKLLVESCASTYTARRKTLFIDSRRVIFEKELEYMGILDSRYVSVLKKEIDGILENSPYDDDVPSRLDCPYVYKQELSKLATFRLRLTDRTSFRAIKDIIKSIDARCGDLKDITDRVIEVYKRLKAKGVSSSLLETAIEKAKEINIQRNN